MQVMGNWLVLVHIEPVIKEFMVINNNKFI